MAKSPTNAVDNASIDAGDTSDGSDDHTTISRYVAVGIDRIGLHSRAVHYNAYKNRQKHRNVRYLLRQLTGLSCLHAYADDGGGALMMSKAIPGKTAPLIPPTNPRARHCTMKPPDRRTRPNDGCFHGKGASSRQPHPSLADGVLNFCRALWCVHDVSMASP